MRKNPPSHEFEVEIHSLSGESVKEDVSSWTYYGGTCKTSYAPRRIHHRRQIRQPGTQFPLRIPFPTHSARLLSSRRCVTTQEHGSDLTLPMGIRGSSRDLIVTPSQHTDGGGLFWIERAEVGKEVAEWPAGVGWVCGGVDERYDTLWRVDG